jgi:hypothetical protein
MCMCMCMCTCCVHCDMRVFISCNMYVHRIVSDSELVRQVFRARSCSALECCSLMHILMFVSLRFCIRKALVTFTHKHTRTCTHTRTYMPHACTHVPHRCTHTMHRECVLFIGTLLAILALDAFIQHQLCGIYKRGALRGGWAR